MARGDYWWVDYRETGIHWAQRLAGEAVPVAEGKCADISELPAPAGASLVVSIPGEKVRVHRVQLPRHNRRRFLASLPYALEDRLLHAPESYHFTAFPSDSSEAEIPVAVVDRAYLGSILASLQQNDWQLLMVCPDYCYIEPPDADTWVLDLSAQPSLLRFPGTAGGAIISATMGQQPPGALLLALEQAPVAPQRILVFTADTSLRDKIEAWRELLQSRGIDVEVASDDSPRLTRLSRSPLPARGFNLLTGPYSVRRRYGREARRLIPLASLTAALLLVWAVNWFIGINQLQQDYSGLQVAIEETYRELFPDARNLVDPRFQMQQQLETLQQTAPANAGTSPGFLHMLEQFAAASDGLDTRLLEMRYDENGMSMELSIPDYQVFEDLQSRLGATMDITVENAELKDERVYSRIQLGAGA